MRASDVCGVVLAGGSSRRMGANKALLEFGGKTLIERQVSLLRSRFAEVVISSNEVSTYAFLRLPVVPDLLPGRGPIAGLHAAFLHSPRESVLLLACDLPDVPATLLDFMVSEIGDFDAAAPRTSDGRAHPLCALYRRSCLRAVERNLARDDNRMIAILEDSSLRVRWLAPGDGTFRDTDLANLNSPEDLARRGEP